MHDQPFTFDALRAAYAAGADPADVMAEALRRVAATGDEGVFITLLDADTVRAQAQALGPYDPDRPLWGLPFAVKDNIDVAGCPTTAACPAYAYTPDQDAAVVARLRAAGAIPIGKTNLDQFATGLVGLRSPYTPPLNALDPAIAPGGSSSGSAVAVAHGAVAFALGTDTAGSGRVPAALNGIVGLKPSLGAVSARGVVPAARTLDTVSIFALTVHDAYAAYAAAAAFDAEDPFSRPAPAPPLTAPPPEFRVTAPDASSLRFNGDTAQADSFEATLDTLASMGATIMRTDFSSFYAVAALLYEGAWIAERETVVADLLRDNPAALHPVTRSIIEPARGLSAADAFRGVYRLTALRRQTDAVLGATDMLCVPSIPDFVTVAELEADPIKPNARMGVYTNFVNLLDLCGLATPVAPRADGRPGGVSLLAARGRDAQIAAVAAALHARTSAGLGATGWAAPPAQDAPVAAQPDELAIAVCGAHMSGLPLNGALTGLGARFLRAARTAPCYRFYALPGGPPARPGLVRQTAGGGAVAVEIWALPRAAIGDLLASIPAPLGLGAVLLEDGATVHGFVCEAMAADGAQDITALGDWRAYLAREPASA